MPKPYIIPVFISHQGCPHQCVFCNQHSITGQEKDATAADAAAVAAAVTAGLALPRRNMLRRVQVAFYGGSFTGLPRERQAELLGAVAPFLAAGKVDAIRLSTRPDYLTGADADFLKARGVGVVELGVQSMADEVLAACQRGHTAAQVGPAVAALRQRGIEVGIQLMVGLPADTPARLVASGHAVAALGPDFVRLYPVLVVRGSELAAWYEDERYQPLSLARAAVLTARLKKIFDEAAIPVVRVGLQHSEALAASLVAGPHHPAFGELVRSYLFVGKVRQGLAGQRRQARELRLSSRDQSLLRGKANANLKRLRQAGLLDGVQLVFDPDLPRDAVLVVKKDAAAGCSSHQ